MYRYLYYVLTIHFVLYRYRTASQKVFEVLSEFSSCVQRASIDEAYVDLTSVVNHHISTNHNIITENDLSNTFVEGYSDYNSEGNLKLRFNKFEV